jgi:hypothetical protein
MTTLLKLAKVCKSKNAGPFEVTLDLIFESREIFDRVAASGVLTPELFARLYKVKPEDVLLTPYPPALAFKATLPRHISSGDVGDTDVYGAQQHAPLLSVDIPMD